MTDRPATDTPVSQLGYDVPAWIEGDPTLADLQSICYGGCASGAYMPAVTYHKAMATMAEHGDDVLAYIDDVIADGLVNLESGDSWAGFACKVLSFAVEQWAHTVFENDWASEGLSASEYLEGEGPVADWWEEVSDRLEESGMDVYAVCEDEALRVFIHGHSAKAYARLICVRAEQEISRMEGGK